MTPDANLPEVIPHMVRVFHLAYILRALQGVRVLLDPGGDSSYDHRCEFTYGPNGWGCDSSYDPTAVVRVKRPRFALFKLDN